MQHCYVLHTPPGSSDGAQHGRGPLPGEAGVPVQCIVLLQGGVLGGRADGEVVVGPADTSGVTTGGCGVGLSVEEGGGWRCGAAQWGRARGGRAQGLAPCWGEEAVREAGWRGVANVDTELAGNVLGDLAMREPRPRWRTGHGPWCC